MCVYSNISIIWRLAWQLNQKLQANPGVAIQNSLSHQPAIQSASQPPASVQCRLRSLNQAQPGNSAGLRWPQGKNAFLGRLLRVSLARLVFEIMRGRNGTCKKAKVRELVVKWVVSM